LNKIVKSYKGKLASEDGWVLKHGAQLRIALCYPNVYSIGMANLGFQAMYELFNSIPEVSCERVFLPDNGRGPSVEEASASTRTLNAGTEYSRNSSGYEGRRARRTVTIEEMREYERLGTPLLSLESQTPVRDFDVIAFSISFETDYVNMVRMLQMSGVTVCSKMIRSSLWAARPRFLIRSRLPTSLM
jgi:hypothetical protein